MLTMTGPHSRSRSRKNLAAATGSTRRTLKIVNQKRTFPRQILRWCEVARRANGSPLRPVDLELSARAEARSLSLPLVAGGCLRFAYSLYMFRSSVASRSDSVEPSATEFDEEGVSRETRT
ncbi:uncharacterized protein LOC119765425 [Culex quinquefasciatus]|uniref:uncharacterized protein LOC119765425 n=1 Tax=Culex quinquefasciatus TaxID=7176 RepID=UPI0018E2F413|nr:uncharacterized protein LOC119765425 [Culex quinquefasciatus]